MASSKKNKTQQDQALAAKRVQFVKANPNLDPAEARKRFFVQTRASELQAKGVEVTKERRQQLRQKFATGGVQRQGFYTPGDLQRIAAAKANSGSKPPVTPEPSGTPSVKPQDLADYKNTVYSNLSKENTARRPVAPKATSKKGFDEQSFNPMQFLKSPLARGVAGAAKGAYNIAESTAESFNATFINPTVNLVGKAVGKNPNLRQAGALEATINTADVALTIATAGVAKGATVPLRGLLPAKQGVIKSATSKLTSKIAAGGKSQVVRSLDEVASAGPRMKVSTPVKSSTPKAGVKSVGSANQTPSFLKGADEPPAFLKNWVDDANVVGGKRNKLVQGPESSFPPMKTGPLDAEDFADMPSWLRETELNRMAEKGIKPPKGVKPLKSTPAAKAKPKATPKPKAAPKAKTAKEVGKERFEATRTQARKDINASNWKDPNNRFADAWDDSPIDMSKVDFSEFGMESAKPYSTARRAAKKTDDVTPAPAPKPAAKKAAPKKSAPKKSAPKTTAPKTTAPKANAKAAFNKSVAPFKSGSQSKLTFETQADYNQFLKTGGKERLRQMSPDVRASFERVNEKWMKGATEAKQAAEEAQKKNAVRALARKGRYDRARPALKAKFNEALIKKQERELLAKVTKKK
jgi:hypothetical protein